MLNLKHYQSRTNKTHNKSQKRYPEIAALSKIIRLDSTEIALILFPPNMTFVVCILVCLCSSVAFIAGSNDIILSEVLLNIHSRRKKADDIFWAG